MWGENSMNIPLCPTKLITDAPPEADFFEGKPHERLASAIKDLIENDIGGKTIGLEGSWGSGKSSVIRFLKMKLKEPETLVFSFDAWAHEGDPLRRSFLERLLKFLVRKDWLDEKDVKDHLNELSGKVIKSTVTTDSKLEPFGVAVLIQTILFPLGLVFLKASLDNNIVFPWMENGGEIDLYFLISLGLFLISLIVIFCFAKKENIFAALIKQSATTTKTTSMESSNPTSVEFETIFLKCLIKH